MRTIAFFVFLSIFCTPVFGDFEAGEKAFQNRDFATAWKELHPLAEKGDARAMEAVGCMYLDGNGVPQDNQKALEYFQKAIEHGNIDAFNNLGFLYTEGIGVKKDPVKAFECYLKAAKNNNFMAQSTVAALYYGGIGVEKNLEKAQKWFIISSENPDTEPDIRAASKAKSEEIGKILSQQQVENARKGAELYKKFVEKKPIDTSKISD